MQPTTSASAAKDRPDNRRDANGLPRLPREIKINADNLYDMWLDGVLRGAAIDYQVAEVTLDAIEAEIADYWTEEIKHFVQSTTSHSDRW